LGSLLRIYKIFAEGPAWHRKQHATTQCTATQHTAAHGRRQRLDYKRHASACAPESPHLVCYQAPNGRSLCPYVGYPTSGFVELGECAWESAQGVQKLMFGAEVLTIINNTDIIAVIIYSQNRGSAGRDFKISRLSYWTPLQTTYHICHTRPCRLARKMTYSETERAHTCSIATL